MPKASQESAQPPPRAARFKSLAIGDAVSSLAGSWRALPLPRRAATMQELRPSQSIDSRLMAMIHPDVDVAAPRAAPAPSDSAGTGPARRRRIALLIATTIASGMGTSVSLQYILRQDRAAANFTTFCLFLWCVVKEAPRLRSHLLAPQVPRRWHMLMAAANWLAVNLQNRALQRGGHSFYTIYLIIKSSNLVVSIVTTWLATRRRYSAQQLLAALAVAAGMLLSTFYSTAPSRTGAGAAGTLGRHIVPSLLLVADLVLLSLKNVATERIFQSYGEQFDEVIFYQSLGGALAYRLDPETWSAISPRLASWHSEWVLRLPSGGAEVPVLWLLLVANIGCCFLVQRSIYGLIATTDAASTTLVTTLYRFGSVLLSALVIDAPPFPPAPMWAGVLIVFAGSFAFAKAPAARPPADDANPTPWLRREASGDEESTRQLLRACASESASGRSSMTVSS